MMEKEKSIIVVADTHFGLRNEMFFEPQVFSGFLRWVKRLENGDVEPLKLGDWDTDKKKMLEPPEKIILIGDILELWDASDRSVEICVGTFAQIFSQLDCEKIYVLGNHDNILEEIASNGKHHYPLGACGLRIIKEVYPNQEIPEEVVHEVRTLKVGKEEYLFVHGQQFDEHFVEIGSAYRIIAYMREAAMAFGNFTWIFVILFILGVIFIPLRWLSPSWWMLILLALLAVPRIFIYIARPVFNAIKSTRYNRLDLNRFKEWWSKFSNDKEYPLKNLNVVFGHTHLIDVRHLKNPDVRLLNIPAWVKDERSQKKREDVLRAAFLYIDEDGSKFIGWDWGKSTPFFIPEKVIEIRRQGRALTDEELRVIGWSREKLMEIGWPVELLKEWEKPLLVEELRRTRREALVQELKMIFHS